MVIMMASDDIWIGTRVLPATKTNTHAFLELHQRVRLGFEEDPSPSKKRRLVSLSAKRKVPSLGSDPLEPKRIYNYNNRASIGNLQVQDVQFFMKSGLSAVLAVEATVSDLPRDTSASFSTFMVEIKFYLKRSCFTAYQPRKEPITIESSDSNTEEIEVVGQKKRKSNEISLARPPVGDIQWKDCLLELFAFLNLRPTFVPDGSGYNGMAANQSAGSSSENAIRISDFRQLYAELERLGQNLGELEPRPGMRCTLKPYQRQGLHWLVSKESTTHGAPSTEDPAEALKLKKQTMDNDWIEYTSPATGDAKNSKKSSNGKPEGEKFYVSRDYTSITSEFPGTSRSSLGGILADEMGMGKTIMMLALIHTNRRIKSRKESDKPYKHATLIVCPTSLLKQWKKETQSKLKGQKMDIRTHYGSSNGFTASMYESSSFIDDGSPSSSDYESDDSRRSHDTQISFLDEDPGPLCLIFTTYGKVLSDFKAWEEASEFGKRRMKQNIFHWKFLRIILDEAHNIKNRAGQTSKACAVMEADARWGITGTPIQNNIDELYALLRFLRFAPWDKYQTWKSATGAGGIDTGSSGQLGQRAQTVIRSIMAVTMLRRTKVMVDKQGKKLVELPKKYIILQYLELSDIERRMYDRIDLHTQQVFSALLSAGLAGKKYAHILALLTRLRQTCCHPMLSYQSLLQQMVMPGEHVPTSKNQTEEFDDADGAQFFGDASDKSREKTIKTLASDLRSMLNEFTAKGSDNYNTDIGSQPSANVYFAISRATGVTTGDLPKDRLNVSMDVPIMRGGRDPCPICRQDIKKGYLLPCYHRFCQVCFTHYCNSLLSIQIEAATAERDKMNSAQDFKLGRKEAELKKRLQTPIMRRRGIRCYCCQIEIGPGTLDEVEALQQEEPIVVDLDDWEVEAPKNNGKPREPEHIDLDKWAEENSSKENDVKLEDDVKKEDPQSSPVLQILGSSNGVKPEEPDIKPKIDSEDPYADSLPPAYQGYFALEKLNFKSSTKMRAMLNAIKMILRHAPESKIVIFSMFVTFISLLESHVAHHPATRHIRFVRLEGSMTQSQRDEAVQQFKRDARAQILFASTKAGGVGLNLAWANFCLIADPWWNSAAEDQAIDRIHRIGQESQVVVVRFIIKNTVEEKMMAIQDTKNSLISEVGVSGGSARKKLGLNEFKRLLLTDEGQVDPLPVMPVNLIEPDDEVRNMPLADGQLVSIREFYDRQQKEGLMQPQQRTLHAYMPQRLPYPTIAPMQNGYRIPNGTNGRGKESVEVIDLVDDDPPAPVHQPKQRYIEQPFPSSSATVQQPAGFFSRFQVNQPPVRQPYALLQQPQSHLQNGDVAQAQLPNRGQMPNGLGPILSHHPTEPVLIPDSREGSVASFELSDDGRERLLDAKNT